MLARASIDAPFADLKRVGDICNGKGMLQVALDVRYNFLPQLIMTKDGTAFWLLGAGCVSDQKIEYLINPCFYKQFIGESARFAQPENIQDRCGDLFLPLLLPISMTDESKLLGEDRIPEFHRKALRRFRQSAS